MFSDIHQANMGMDASRLLPGGWHPYAGSFTYPSKPGEVMQELPKKVKRTGAGVHYYFLNFGNSVRFTNPNPTQRRILGISGRNRRAPELSKTVPYDPFPVDVLMLGDVFAELDQVCSCASVLPQLIFDRCLVALASSVLLSIGWFKTIQP
jgi:hypothetical protein